MSSSMKILPKEMHGEPSMQIHHIQTIVSKDGSVTIAKVPFSAGDPVEVIILPSRRKSESTSGYPLRGTPIEYKDPTEPVVERSWEALA